MLQKEIKIPGIGGMDLDTVDSLLAPNNTRKLWNGRRTRSNSGETGSVHNILGTSLIDNSVSFSENAKTVGVIQNERSQTIIYFVADENRGSGIFEYSHRQESIQTVLFNESALKISYKSKIHGFIVNDLLYWNDSINGMFKVNLTKAKLYTSGDTTNGYPIIDEQTLSFYKRPPIQRIVPEYMTDDTKMTNNLRGRLFQFRYSFVYDDNEESRASVISTVNFPEGDMDFSGEIAGQLYKNNVLKLSLYSGHHTVVKIKIYARQGNNGLWGLVETIDKKDKGITDNSFFDYKFYNDKTLNIVSQDEINILFDKIPNKQNRIAYLHTNQIALAGIQEGYNKVSGLNINLTPKLNATDPVAKGGEVNKWVGYDDMIEVEESYYADTYISGEMIDGFDANNLPAVNNLIVVNINGKEKTFLVDSQTAADAGTFRQKVNTFINENFDGYVSQTAMTTISGNPISASQLFVYYDYDNSQHFQISLTEYHTVSNIFKPYTCFKSGASHPFGIVYYDENFRSGFVNEIDRVYLPFITENNADQYFSGQKTQNLLYSIQWEINHKPPVWAKYYQFVYGLDTDVLSFRQYIINGLINADNNTLALKLKDSQTAIDISPLQNHKDVNSGTQYDYSFPNSSIEPYSFNKGDRIRFLTKAKTDFSSGDGLGDLLNYYLDIEILDYIIDKKEQTSGDPIITHVLIVQKIDATQFPDIGENSLVEIYTPKKEQDEIIYHETGGIHLILNPGTDKRAHQGDTANQVFDDSGNQTSPAKGEFTKGDAYFLSTVFDKNLSANQGSAAVSIVESASASNFYDQKIYDIGRINIVSDNFVGQTLPIVRLSGKYFEGTQINRLSTFDATMESYLSSEFGEITGLVESGYVLKAIQEHKVTSFYIGREGLQLAGGNELQVGSNSVLSRSRPSITDFGSQHPESILLNGSYIYFVDVSKGVIVRNDNNGNIPISDGYIRSEISKICNQIKDAQEPKILTSLNPITNEIMFTFGGKDINGNEIDYGTYIFSENDKKWDSVFQYSDDNQKTPEYFAYIGKDYVSFLNGKLWHHETNAERNNFYGIQKPVKIELIFNKTVGYAKLFKTIEVIGKGDWYCPDDIYISIPKEYSVIGREQNSKLSKDNFHRLAGKRYAAFQKDINTYEKSPFFSLKNGKDLKGQLIYLTLVNESPEDSNLSEVLIGYQYMQLT